MRGVATAFRREGRVDYRTFEQKGITVARIDFDSSRGNLRPRCVIRDPVSNEVRDLYLDDTLADDVFRVRVLGSRRERCKGIAKTRRKQRHVAVTKATVIYERWCAGLALLVSGDRPAGRDNARVHDNSFLGYWNADL